MNTIAAKDSSGVANACLVPMTHAWLDAVMHIEQRAYEFPWSRGNFIDSLAAGYAMSCLTSTHGELLGYRVVMPGFHEMHLLNITVEPNQQGRGWARLMLRELISQAHTTQSECIWLEVRPSNLRARNLYQRFGFEEVGLRPGYYPALGDSREDAVVMRRNVGNQTANGDDLT